MNKKSNKNMPQKIYLLAIGSELLNGETRDSNLAWLIRTLTRKGARIVHASMVPDNFEAVSCEIEQAKSHGADILITTGGLGPSDDDATLAYIARALNLELALDKTALRMVKERIAALSKFRPGMSNRITRQRRAMAFLPEGSIPLKNPVGVAPGMFLDGSPVIISLPGVPVEMKAIFKDTLKEYWRELFAGVCYVRRNIKIFGIPEADLAPFMRRVSLLDPEIYIKSRLKMIKSEKKRVSNPSLECQRWMILLHFSLTTDSSEEGYRRIDRLINAIIKDLKRHYPFPIEIENFSGPHV